MRNQAKKKKKKNYGNIENLVNTKGNFVSS